MSAAPKMLELMIPAKKLPRAIAYVPVCNPLSEGLLILIRAETQPALPSPSLQYKHRLDQQWKNPCFLQVAGGLLHVCIWTSFFCLFDWQTEPFCHFWRPL